MTLLAGVLGGFKVREKPPYMYRVELTDLQVQTVERVGLVTTRRNYAAVRGPSYLAPSRKKEKFRLLVTAMPGYYDDEEQGISGTRLLDVELETNIPRYNVHVLAEMYESERRKMVRRRWHMDCGTIFNGPNDGPGWRHKGYLPFLRDLISSEGAEFTFEKRGDYGAYNLTLRFILSPRDRAQLAVWVDTQLEAGRL